MRSLRKEHDQHDESGQCPLCDGCGIICAACEDEITDIYELVEEDSLVSVVVCVGCRASELFHGAVIWWK